MSGPFAGSTVPPADYGGTQLAGSQQFDRYVGVAMALASQKIYFNDGEYPATVITRFTQLLNAGVQLVACYRPPFTGLPSTTYPTDRTQLGTSVAALVSAAASAGAPTPKVVLWQEPQNGQNNMSASQCHQMFTYYAATVRGAGAKVIYDTATHGGSAAALSYYPGASLCDEVLADFYGNTFERGVRLDGPGSLVAQAQADSKPFGWGELGSTLDPSQTPTQAQQRAYFNYVIGVITPLLADGLASDSMWYNGITNNWNTINSSTDFRVSLLNQLWNAYQPGPGPPPPPPPPPPPQPVVAGAFSNVTWGPAGALDAVLAAADDAQRNTWPTALAKQHVAFDPQSWSALMPNPQTIPVTLTLQGTPPLNIPGATSGQVLVSDANGNLTPGSSAAASVNFKPTSPTGTTSVSEVMMGLGATVTYTPATTGIVTITITGYATASGGAANVTLDPRSGTGTAPANGAAATGTPFGNGGAGAAVHVGGTTNIVAFAFTDRLTLTAGTQYWFDLAIATSANTGSIQNLSINIAEQLV